MKRVKLCFWVTVITLTACDNKGPQSHATFPDRSADEIVYETVKLPRTTVMYINVAWNSIIKIMETGNTMAQPRYITIPTERVSAMTG